MSASPLWHQYIFNRDYFGRYYWSREAEEFFLSNIRKSKGRVFEEREREKKTDLFIKTVSRTRARSTPGDINVVLHQFKRFDFWTMCKFVWEVCSVCVRVDFLVRCQCQRIFVFPCRRNRWHRHRVFFSFLFLFHSILWKKEEVYTFPFLPHSVGYCTLYPKNSFVFVWRVVFVCLPRLVCLLTVSFPNGLERRRRQQKMCLVWKNHRMNTQMNTKLRDKKTTQQQFYNSLDRI